jgi:hypothetical protein
VVDVRLALSQQESDCLTTGHVWDATAAPPTCSDSNGAAVVAADESECTLTGYTWTVVDNAAVQGQVEAELANRLSTRNPAEDLEKMRLAYAQLTNIINMMEAGCEKLVEIEEALPVDLSYAELQDVGKPCPPSPPHHQGPGQGPGQGPAGRKPPAVCRLPDCDAGCELRVASSVGGSGGGANGTNVTAGAQKAQVVFEEVDLMVGKTMQGIELYVGLLYGLRGFKLMLPAALSLGPGMVQGALNVKLIVPQSSLPGFIVTLLPWMYCPLMWCIYNFAAQAMNRVWVLIGLVVLAYAPMVRIFEPFIYKNEHFAKTGSGQTWCAAAEHGNASFCATFSMKHNRLPRQAQDRQKGCWKHRKRFSAQAFVVVGSVKEIAKPMTDQEALVVTKAIKQVNSLLMALAVICVGIFAIKANSAGDEVRKRRFCAMYT